MSTTTNGTNGTADPNVLVFGETEVQVDQLHPNTVREAIARALRHVMRNEVASKVATAISKIEEDGELDSDEKTAKIAELENDAREAFKSAMYDGTWGSGMRGPSGPRLGAFDSELRNLVAAHVRGLLRGLVKQGWTYDKDAKEYRRAEIRDADGNVTHPALVRTVDETVDAFMASEKPDTVAKMAVFKEQAKEAVEAKKRRADALKSVMGADAAELNF